MDILFVAPYVPSRIRVRPFHFISEIARRHRVHVIALGEVGGPCLQSADELASLVQGFTIVPHSRLRGYWQSLLALPGPHPMCTSFCRSTAMSRAISEIMARVRFDLVHVEHLRAAHFAPVDPSVPVVFDSVDCLTGLFRQMARSRRNPLARLLMLEETCCLRRYEPAALRRFERVIVTSDSEREELMGMGGHPAVDVVPNGVDTGYFAPRGSERRPARFVFTGKMSYSPNAQAALWFAEKVFPAVREAAPRAEFVIAGSAPPPRVRALDAASGVRVTGYVEDIRPWLDSACIAVAPMQVAVGIQNKMLEAMAMGLPVIATSLACRTFGENCPGIVEADTVEQTTRAAVRLALDPVLAAEIGSKGREEVLGRFSWESSVNRLEKIYHEVGSTPRTQALRNAEGVR